MTQRSHTYGVRLAVVDGEAVLTPGQMRALGVMISHTSQDASQAPPVNISVHIDNRVAHTQARADTRRHSDGSISLDIIVEHVESHMARNIGRGEGMAPLLERRYGLNPAAGLYRT